MQKVYVLTLIFYLTCVKTIGFFLQFWGFPDISVGKESTYNSGDLGSIPRLGRSLRERKGYPLLYSGLENALDRIVHRVAKSWTQLSDFHFHSLSCVWLCNPMDCSTPCFPVLHYLPEFAQTHVRWVGDAIQPSHPLSSPSLALSLSQHQGLFQWVSSSY